jgi:hypothetical protein
MALNTALLGLAALLLLLPWAALCMRADKVAELRGDTVRMFYHGFSNYIQHAFPEDEVRSGARSYPPPRC